MNTLLLSTMLLPAGLGQVAEVKVCDRSKTVRSAFETLKSKLGDKLKGSRQR